MIEEKEFKLRLPDGKKTSSSEPLSFPSLEDYPYKTISLSTTHSNLTGLWRYWRPVFDTKRAPCDAACPVGNQIVDLIQTALDGGLREAANLLRLENPLPAVTARVCHRPCEIQCNRREYDRAVSIHTIEGFLAGITDDGVCFPNPPQRRRAAVVGSGPAELSFAHFLLVLGHAVTLFDSAERLGGKLRSGPQARLLPDELLDVETMRIASRGLDVRRETPDILFLTSTFDAVFGAISDPERLSLHILDRMGEKGQTDEIPPTGKEEVSEKSSLRVSDAIGYGKWTAILLDAGWRGLDVERVIDQVQVAGNPRILSAVKYLALLSGEEVRRSEMVVTYAQLQLETWNPKHLEPSARSSLLKDMNLPRWMQAGQPDEALQEAARCFSCGRCNGCDNCWIYCPEGLISRSGGDYTINYTYCKGCLVCAAVCPRRAITVVEEKK